MSITIKYKWSAIYCNDKYVKVRKDHKDPFKRTIWIWKQFLYLIQLVAQVLFCFIEILILAISYRKSSIVEDAATGLHQNPFESVTQHLEALPLDCPELSFEQVIVITEPIIRHTRNEDLMNLAKSTSKNLYVGFPPDERVAKINELVSGKLERGLYQYLYLY